jgi:HK97 family phage prohead protease
MKIDMQTKQFKFTSTETKQSTINGIPVGIVRGYASAFSVDRGNDRVMPGAFKSSLDRHIADGSRPIRLLSQHDYVKLPIGGIPPELAREDDSGLLIEAQINLEVQEGREVYALAKQGVLSDFSIGFRIKDSDVSDGVRLIKDLELMEVSIVSEPMQPDAKITEVKAEKDKYFIDIAAAKKVISKKEFEKMLRESNVFSKDAAVYLAARFELSRREVSNNEKSISDVVSKINEITSFIKS